MAATPLEIRRVRRIVQDVPDIDQALPIWARRTNPIVRRQLGPYWRVFPPEMQPILYWIGIQAGVILATLVIPMVYLPVLITVMVAGIGFPLMLYVYGRALVEIMDDSTSAMTREYRNDTIMLLRATPFTTREIILSKVSASIWRRMDAMTLTLVFTMVVGLPVILVLYMNRFPPEDVPYLAHTLAFFTFIASIVRIPLELFMVASLGVMLGATVRIRNSAFMSGLVFLFFYFLLLNLPRLLPLSWPLQLVVDAVLPVVLPPIIAVGSLYFAEKQIASD